MRVGVDCNGIAITKRQYTTDEKKFILKSYRKLGPSKIAKKLNRTKRAIETIARRLFVAGIREKGPYLIVLHHSPTMLAWAAGILEADGCFHCTQLKDSNGWKRCVSVDQLPIRKDMLESMQKLFGGTIRVFRKSSCTDKEVLVWRVHSKKDISMTIEQVLPYIVTKQKRQQAMFLLSKCNEV